MLSEAATSSIPKFPGTTADAITILCSCTALESRLFTTVPSASATTISTSTTKSSYTIPTAAIHSPGTISAALSKHYTSTLAPQSFLFAMGPQFITIVICSVRSSSFSTTKILCRHHPCFGARLVCPILRTHSKTGEQDEGNET